jgi:hypothetical protein
VRSAPIGGGGSDGAAAGRGIAATGAENREDLVDLVSAVEPFEAAVEAHGSDLIVDDLKSARS